MLSPERQPIAKDQTNRKRLLLFVLLVSVASALYYLFRDSLTVESLIQQERSLRSFHAQHPYLILSLALCTYAIMTSVPVPGAAFMSLLFGWYFGVVTGSVLVNFGATGGALLGFLQSRYFFRDLIQSKFGNQLYTINKALKKEGALYLLTLRLVPIIPFFLLNALMGLTSIRLRTYWWASQVGMLPASIIYVYAGSTIPDLATLAKADPRTIVTPQLLIAFALLGLLPFATKWVMRRWAQK